MHIGTLIPLLIRLFFLHRQTCVLITSHGPYRSKLHNASVIEPVPSFLPVLLWIILAFIRNHSFVTIHSYHLVECKQDVATYILA